MSRSTPPIVVALTILVAGCTPTEDTRERPPAEELEAFDANEAETLDAPAEEVETAIEQSALQVEEGEATYYADKFEGRRTASGTTFRQSEMVAAHKAFPFGTRLRVTNLANDRTVEVRVVDRGPFGSAGRATPVLDLSRAAAERLDFTDQGRTRVRIEVLEWGP